MRTTRMGPDVGDEYIPCIRSGDIRRVRAVIAYDGTDYSGFQRQVNAPTVQGALEAALAQVTQQAFADNKRPTVLAAGRTDAGVHAVGQVIAFDTAWRHELSDLWRALNAVLPDDIVVLKVEEAAADFHPRYDARSRWYRYTVYNAPVRSPLTRRYSLHVPAPLDVATMQRAAQALLGEHDFAAFGRSWRGRCTVRRVLTAEWSREYTCLIFDIEANAFLYRMVRSIVGTVLQVGLGDVSLERFEAVLASRDRSQAGPPVAPCGLCLMEVKY